MKLISAALLAALLLTPGCSSTPPSRSCGACGEVVADAQVTTCPACEAPVE